MYKDLNGNKDKIVSNPIIKALCGNKSDISQIPNELTNFDHDKNIRPIDTFQVVDADSSQLDAILLSKKGISFVLQGPPGTGKSQTITNIIAEALSDGKKVLFVSEKMAALEVVKKRLTQAGLDKFCLTLHSYKANKKEILGQLAKTLIIERISVREEAIYKLATLEEKRKKLNEYNEQIHMKCKPLNISIFEANGRLAKLLTTDDIIFGINDVENTDIDLLNKYAYLLSEFSKTIGKLSEHYSENPWYGCNVQVVTHELRHDIEVNLNRLLTELKNLFPKFEWGIEITGFNKVLSINNLLLLIELLDFCSRLPILPLKWLSEDISKLSATAKEYLDLSMECNNKLGYLVERYTEDFFKLDAESIITTIEAKMDSVGKKLNVSTFPSNKEIVLKAGVILTECKELREFIQALHLERLEVSKVLNLEPEDTISKLQEFRELLKLILLCQQPKGNWFNTENELNITKILNSVHEEQNSLKENLLKLTSDFSEEILNIEFALIISKIENDFMPTITRLAITNHLSDNLDLDVNTVLFFADNQVQQLESSYKIIQNAQCASKEIDSLLGVKPNETLQEMISLGEFLAVLLQKPKPTLAWFDESKELAINKIINDTKDALLYIEKETNELLAEYHKDIFNIDYKNILVRFNTEYGGITKFFKSSYRADKKTISAIRKEQKSKLVDQDIILILNKIAEIKEKKQWLFDNKSLATEMLGELYFEGYTNWDIVDKSRKSFNTIKNYFGGSNIPEKLKQILLEGKHDIVSVHSEAIKKLSELDIDFLEEFLGEGVESINTFSLCNSVHNAIDSALGLNKYLVEMRQYSINQAEFKTYKIRDIVKLLKMGKEINTKRDWFKDNSSVIEEYFGNHFIGEDTDWDAIKGKFETTQKIINFFGNEGVPQKLVSCLLSNGTQNKAFEMLRNRIDNINSQNITQRLFTLLNLDDISSLAFSELIKTLEDIENDVNTSYRSYGNVTNCAKIEINFELIMGDLAALKKVQEISSNVEENSPGV